MIANLMASSVSLISSTEKKSQNHSNQLQSIGQAPFKHSDSEPAADKCTMENISQEDTSDGQGRESVHVLASHSPEQLSSPRMPLSPMAASQKGAGFGPAYSLCGKSSVIGGDNLLAKGDGNSMVAFLAEGDRNDAEIASAAQWEGIDAAARVIDVED